MRIRMRALAPLAGRSRARVAGTTTLIRLLEADSSRAITAPPFSV
jgi:hypothetical protein